MPPALAAAAAQTRRRKSEVDGLSPLCDGARIACTHTGRLVTRRGLSETRAAEECKRRFDVSGRSCGHCGDHLPATFFHQGKYNCISCLREYRRLWREGHCGPYAACEQQCTRCHRTLPAVSFPKNRTAPSGFLSACKQCKEKQKKLSRESIRQGPLPAAMQSSERRCTTCQQVKVRSAFYARTASLDGFATKCKACDKMRKEAYRGPGGLATKDSLSECS
mmetsp:Transcript_2916/g.8521  ORF Transcript_2916/g.8521 Transcript_2916/m.8521 type:complete len:221 (-) Transcript_2916:433-1095(-)